MKTIIVLFLTIMGFCQGSFIPSALCSTIHAAEEVKSSEFMNTEIQVMTKYLLGSGDRIEISVFDETELSFVTLLGDTGIINYPFLGQLNLTGLTVKQVEAVISEGLKGSYLINPSVQVSVVEYRPFFVDGEVNSAGGYPYQPGLNVGKAIALAGGFTERASKTAIYISRTNDNNVKKVKVTLTDPVYPDDIINVEESFF